MYRTVSAIESTMGFLAAWFPQYVTRVTLPEPSVEGRTISAMRIRRGGGGERRGVLFVGGTHARELMNPDALVDLSIDLVASALNDSDIVYGERTWPARTVGLMLDTLDLWIAPCINPDGRHYVMTVDDMWRKNRRDNLGTSCDGVDLNRNQDILWGVTEGVISCNPCSDTYCGPSAFSEPETRNVKYLLDSRRIDCFVDVHSFSELVLYPWGHAPTQTTDPTQRFTGLPTGTCSPIGVDGYEEYMPPRDLQRFQTVSQRVVDAIADVRGRAYTPQASVALYATTGTFGDYPYSRHIADGELRKTYSFTFETGPYVGNAADSFHPADPRPIKTDAKSGLLALAQQCICAIELIGHRLLGGDREVDRLRRVRDDMLATTDAGRDWIALFERAQGPLVEVVAGDDELARDAAYLIQRAAAVLDAGGVVDDADAERAQSFLAELAERGVDKRTRKDLERVGRRVRELSGTSAEEFVADLMQVPPGKRDKRDKAEQG